MEVTRAEFAHMAGVSRAAVSNKLKNGTLILNSAGMMETDNPVNRHYLDRHEKKNRERDFERNLMQSREASPSAQKETPKRASTGGNAGDAAIDRPMLKMTLGELIERHGDIDGIDRFVKIQKDLVTIEEKKQRLQERRLQQLPRDFTIARLFGYLQQQSARVLDVPEAAADQVRATVLADPEGSRQRVIEYLRGLLSRAIGGAKEHVLGELRSLRAKYEEPGESLDDKIEELLERQEG